MRWTYNLNSDVYSRLCRCASLKRDILPLARAKWESLKDKSGYTPEDALVYVLELLDENSCYFDLTKEEYNDTVNTID